MSEDITLTYGADIQAVRTALGGIKDDAENAAKGFATSFASALGESMKGLAMRGGSTILGFSREVLTDSVVAAVDAEEAMLKLDRAVRRAGEGFEYSAEQLDKASTALSRQSRFSKAEIQALQETLMALEGTSEQFRTLQNLSVDLASALGTTLPAAGKMLADGLKDPVKLLEDLTKAGIDVGDAVDKVKELGELGSLPGLDQTQLTLNLLVEALRGISGEGTTTARGAVDQLEKSFENLKRTIGEALMPVVEVLPDIVTALLDQIEGFLQGTSFETFGNWVKDLAASIVVFIESIDERFKVWMAEIRLIIAELSLAMTFMPGAEKTQKRQAVDNAKIAAEAAREAFNIAGGQRRWDEVRARMGGQATELEQVLPATAKRQVELLELMSGKDQLLIDIQQQHLQELRNLNGNITNGLPAIAM